MHRIFFRSHGYRDYKRLPHDIRESLDYIFRGMFRENPLSKTLDVKKLNMPFSGYRLRFGSYRMLFTIEKDSIQIYSIKHRKDAYK